MSCIEASGWRIDKGGLVGEIILNIEGMHCGACVRRVTRALEHIPGAEVMEVRIGAARVNTEDPAKAIAAIAKAGYTAHTV